MKQKIFKIVLVVALVSLILVCSVVPSFALQQFGSNGSFRCDLVQLSFERYGSLTVPGFPGYDEDGQSVTEYTYSSQINQDTDTILYETTFTQDAKTSWISQAYYSDLFTEGTTGLRFSYSCAPTTLDDFALGHQRNITFDADQDIRHFFDLDFTVYLLSADGTHYLNLPLNVFCSSNLGSEVDVTDYDFQDVEIYDYGNDIVFFNGSLNLEDLSSVINSYAYTQYGTFVHPSMFVTRMEEYFRSDNDDSFNITDGAFVFTYYDSSPIFEDFNATPSFTTVNPLQFVFDTIGGVLDTEIFNQIKIGHLVLAVLALPLFKILINLFAGG